MVELGILAARTGQTLLAKELLERALGFQPGFVLAMLQLARVLRSLRGQKAAIDLCDRALSTEPELAEAHFLRGICHLDIWRVDEAVAALERAVALQRDYGSAHDRLGYALYLAGRLPEAEAALRRAVELMPGQPNSLVNLGAVLRRQGRIAEADEALRRGMDGASKSPQLLVAYGRANIALGENTAAEAALRRAVHMAPRADQPRMLLAELLQETGKFSDAKQLVKDGLALSPKDARLYRELVNASKFRSEDRSTLPTMHALVDQPDLPPEAKVHLHFALGKAYDDLGEYEMAMPHFRQGNAITKNECATDPFDAAEHARKVDSIIETYNPELMAKLGTHGSDSNLPVFIVGMMRSGTTLTEQILSSHPDVGAMGELTYVQLRAPESGELEAEPTRLKELADGYLNLADVYSSGTSRVTDKMPFNFMWVGLIHLMFPNSTIVHCRRNPIDTCVSAYQAMIPVNFAHSFEDLAACYKDYLRLMEHWREVLPPGRMFELDYEQLVWQPSESKRALVKSTGLAWDDAVDHHTENSRPINTASKWQARQPIYSGSIARWRRYEPWIGDLLTALSRLNVVSGRAELL